MSSFDCLDCNVSSNESYFELIRCFVLYLHVGAHFHGGPFLPATHLLEVLPTFIQGTSMRYVLTFILNLNFIISQLLYA